METPTLCKIMDASYTSARDLLNAAARTLDEAAEAARNGNANLARGTAIGAEGDLQKAVSLIAAVSALQQLGRG